LDEADESVTELGRGLNGRQHRGLEDVVATVTLITLVKEVTAAPVTGLFDLALVVDLNPRA
jgi:inhibitor of KinA sporulation pathway (predicted exonuclease)